MAQKLQLEYTCTEAERQEAQTLGLRKQLGGGSKWRTRLVLAVLGAGLVLEICFKMRESVPAGNRPYVLGGAFLVAFIFVLWKQKRRKGEAVVNRVEVSEEGVRIVMGEASEMRPWSAFSDFVESPNLFVLMDRRRAVLTLLPKRAFPSESWQTWFRSLASNRPKQVEQIQTPQAPLAASADRITLKYRLALRDYFDRALASWRTWGMILGVAGLLLGISISLAVHPPPDAIYSAGHVYLSFVLPFTLVLAVMIFLLSSVYPWVVYGRHLKPQETALSAEGVGVASPDGTSLMPWTAASHYKETRWSFILWSGWGSNWMLVPKRAFDSPDDLERSRALLAGHLRRSRWFFG